MGEAAPQGAGGKPPGQMTEDELCARARAALNRVVELPVGSLGRSIQWAVHDTAMEELALRAEVALAEALRKG